MPELFAIGISHKTAPVAVREGLAFSASEIKRLLGDLSRCRAIHEVVVLSTCNRTELYVSTSDSIVAEADALGQLALATEIPPTELSSMLTTYYGLPVSTHLMRVAGGLESMVLGESEILGQIKAAHELALEAHTGGPVINRLFSYAITAGKRIQTETGIGARHLSIAGAAVNLARETLGDLADRRTLVIGAGGHGELSARALADAGARAVFVANRNYDRALRVAHSVGGEAVHLENLPEELADADIVLSATASPHTLIHREDLEQVITQRNGRELLILDIAVPRDIEPEVAELDGVTLLDIDDLQKDVEHSMILRRGETAKAEKIVAEEMNALDEWLSTLDVVPTISDLRRRGDEIAQRVIAENLGRFESLSQSDRARVDSMARAIISRLLHEPTKQLKQASGEEEGIRYAEALRKLFALDDPALDAAAGTNLTSEDESLHDAEIHSLDEKRRNGCGNSNEA